MIGQILNHYRVLEKLGSGGMGEVYLAEDTRLNRRVALKVLPAGMASDPERRERFEREAQAVAALNHPNIVTIHSVEQASGTHFITMELIRGKTLSETIPPGGMPLARIFEIAIPLSDAVSAAHKRGITHRDIKPDNVMLTEEGRVKILDFGLVKLREETAGDPMGSQLPTANLTLEGRVMGTVAYMSPEQAEGKPVDHRTDIFSLGVVLYQMATGTQPFRGDTRISVLSSILRDVPASVTDLNPGLPRHLGRIIKRCLAKDPEERYQTCQDLRSELVELRKEVDSGAVQPVGVSAHGASALGRRKGPGYALIAICVLAVAAVGYLLLRPRGQPDVHQPAPVQGSFTQVTDQNGQEIFPTLSPDGRMVAFASRVSGNWDIYVQSVGGRNAVNVTKNSIADDDQPSFSPDGQKIAFRSRREEGGIFVMGVLGDSVIRLTDTGSRPAWSPDGREIAYETEAWVNPGARLGSSQLWALDVSARQKRKITDGDAVQPAWSPHGQRIAYWAIRANSGQRDLWTLPAGGGEPVPATQDQALDWSPVWSPDGRFLYFISDRGGSMNIWRIPIDETSGEVRGSPQSVTQAATGSARDLRISGDGKRLVYGSALVRMNVQKYPLDPAAGKVAGEPTWVTSGSEQLSWADPSPDGQWLVFVLQQGRQEDLFVCRADGSDRRQLTDDAARDRMPRWSPDGRKIAFYSDRSGNYEIWMVSPDGSGLTQVTHAPGKALAYPVWSPDGSRMFVSDLNGSESFSFDPTQPWGGQKPETLPPTDVPGTPFAPLSWSPDGKMLAGYLSHGAGFDSGGMIYDLEKRTYRRVTQSGSPPVWFGDRRLIYGNDRGEVFILDAESGKSRSLLSVAPDYFVPMSLRISRDGRALYLVRVNNQSDIWMFTLE